MAAISSIPSYHVYCPGNKNSLKQNGWPLPPTYTDFLKCLFRYRNIKKRIWISLLLRWLQLEWFCWWIFWNQIHCEPNNNFIWRHLTTNSLQTDLWWNEILNMTISTLFLDCNYDIICKFHFFLITVECNLRDIQLLFLTVWMTIGKFSWVFCISNNRILWYWRISYPVIEETTPILFMYHTYGYLFETVSYL